MKASILRVVVYMLLQTQLSVTWMSNSLLSMVGNSYDDQGRSLIPDSLLASNNNALLIYIIYIYMTNQCVWREDPLNYDCEEDHETAPWILGWVLQSVTQHWAHAEECDFTTPTLRTFALFMFTLATWPRWIFSAHHGGLNPASKYKCFFTIFNLNVQSWLDNKSQRFVKQ